MLLAFLISASALSASDREIGATLVAPVGGGGHAQEKKQLSLEAFHDLAKEEVGYEAFLAMQDETVKALEWHAKHMGTLGNESTYLISATNLNFDPSFFKTLLSMNIGGCKVKIKCSFAMLCESFANQHSLLRKHLGRYLKQALPSTDPNAFVSSSDARYLKALSHPNQTPTRLIFAAQTCVSQSASSSTPASVSSTYKPTPGRWT